MNTSDKMLFASAILTVGVTGYVSWRISAALAEYSIRRYKSRHRLGV